MSRRSAIWIVARRELRIRLRSRSYLIATVVLAIGIVAAIVLPAVVDIGGGPPRLAVVDPVSGVATAIDGAGRATGEEIQVVSIDDAATARTRLRDGDVDAVLLGEGPLLYAENEDPRLTATVAVGLAHVSRTGVVDEIGVTPAQRQALLAPPDLEVTTLDPGAADEGARRAVTTVALVLLFIAITSYGSGVLSSVVEEKSNRVIELTLSRVRARDVLAGKVLGVGLLGLAQLGVVALAGIVTLLLIDRAEVPFIGVGSIASLALWFMIGFALYDTIFATLGSLASRQEDAQAAVMPVWLVLGVIYAYGFVAVEEPDALLTRLLSYVPLSAPFIMPMRSLGGDVAWWETAAAAVLAIVTAVACLWLGGRVYAGAALRFGKRIKMREAWRTAQT